MVNSAQASVDPATIKNLHKALRAARVTHAYAAARAARITMLMGRRSAQRLDPSKVARLVRRMHAAQQQQHSAQLEIETFELQLQALTGAEVAATDDARPN